PRRRPRAGTRSGRPAGSGPRRSRWRRGAPPSRRRPRGCPPPDRPDPAVPRPDRAPDPGVAAPSPSVPTYPRDQPLNRGVPRTVLRLLTVAVHREHMRRLQVRIEPDRVVLAPVVRGSGQLIPDREPLVPVEAQRGHVQGRITPLHVMRIERTD